MNKLITEQTAQGEITYDIFSQLSSERILFIYDHVNDKTATDIVSAIIYLNKTSNDKISLYINTESGDIRATFMIYDVMKISKAPIETFCLGAAMGAPLLLLAGGFKGCRYATKSAMVCLSNIDFDNSIYSGLSEISSYKKQYEFNNKSYLESCAKASGQPIKKIIQDAKKNNFMSSAQAKKYGFIDHIVTGNNKKTKK